MRYVKLAAWSLLSVLGLLVLAAVAVVVFVDPNDYKERLSQAVRDKTGRELKLQGDLSLSLFPWLAIETGHIELGNAAGFGTDAFAVIDSADIGVKLLSLLHKDLQIRRITLKGLQLNLVKNEQGRSNWEDLSNRSVSSEPASQGTGLKSLAIAGVTVENASLDYRDTSPEGTDKDSHYRIRQLDLETGTLTSGRPFKLKLKGSLDRGAGSSAMLLNLHTEAALDTAAESYGFKDFALDATLHTPPAKDSAARDLPIKLRVPELKLALKEQTLQAATFQMEVDSATLSGSLAGRKILDAPAFSGRLSLQEAAPRKLFELLGMEAPQTRDAEVLKTVGFDAALQATASSVELQDLKLKLDQTNVSGRFGVADFDTMALRFALTVDRIDLDRYLAPEPPQTAAAKQTGSPAAAPKAAPTPLPVDMLKALNAQGTLDIGALTVSGVKLSAVKIKIDAADGLVRLDPSQARLYGGAHRGTAVLDARDPVAKLSLQESLSGIDFAPLMLELFDSKRFTGRGNANATLTARGNDSGALFKSLDGKLDFSVAEGAVIGADLGYEVQRAQALLKREALPAGASSGKTAFKTMKGSATIAKSVLDNRDLAIEADYLKVTGGGTLNLDTQAIDYKVNTTVAGRSQGVEIPVRITGTLGDMKIRPDIEGKVKAEVQKKVDEKKEEIKEKLTDKLNQWLQKKK